MSSRLYLGFLGDCDSVVVIKGFLHDEAIETCVAYVVI